MKDPNAKTLINHKLVNEMKSRRMVPELLVTMSPSFGHFQRFAADKRVSGIRFNTAMTALDELDKELAALAKVDTATPVFYDVKSRQIRIIDIESKSGNLVLTINHPIEVETPCEVLFKAGADVALLDSVSAGGQILTFNGGPRYKLVRGESLHFRNKTFRNTREDNKGESVISSIERQKIEKAKKAGINKFFLSYVEKQSDVDQLRELVGKDSEIWLKIESIAGMEYVARHFKKQDNVTLVAARGDLFVELDKPHHILAAQRQIIEADPLACVGSRILLSVVEDPVPSCADLTEIAWLHDIGYRRFMLCDEICLKENLLGTAVAVFDGIKNEL